MSASAISPKRLANMRGPPGLLGASVLMAITFVALEARIVVAAVRFELFAENHQVLPRQRVDRFDMFETRRVHFLDRLFLAHLVHLFDRDALIFLAKFDQDDTAFGSQRHAYLTHDLVRKVELVV